jgi:hypothetical protein
LPRSLIIVREFSAESELFGKIKNARAMNAKTITNFTLCFSRLIASYLLVMNLNDINIRLLFDDPKPHE